MDLRCNVGYQHTLRQCFGLTFLMTSLCFLRKASKKARTLTKSVLTSNIVCEIHLIQWVLNYPNSNYPYSNTWTSPPSDTVFLAAAGNRHCSQWGSVTGESKAAAWTTFPKCYNAFFCQYGI